jgi:hypothetical protein
MWEWRIVNSRRATVVVALSLGVVLSGRLGATVLLPADFTQMVSESQLIVHARVIGVRGELAGSRRSIESLVTVAVVSSPLKGATGDEVVFRVPGGRVGRYRRIFVGAPVFKAGDEVVLFLKGRAPAIAVPFGLSQGVYRVSRATGTPMVIPVPPTEAVAGIPRGDSSRKPVALDEFARQVRLAAGNLR